MTLPIAEVPAEHRRRRREAHERAAAAYQRAADRHREAARFFSERKEGDRATRHRAASDADAAKAQRERNVAGRQ